MGAVIGPLFVKEVVHKQGKKYSIMAADIALANSVDFKVSPMDYDEKVVGEASYDLVETIGFKSADMLLTMNAIFGIVFFISLGVTIWMMICRKIDDHFMKYAMYCMVLALALSIVMCFIIASYNMDMSLYLADQTIAWQQVYFELPFYMFLIVISSILFSW